MATLEWYDSHKDSIANLWKSAHAIWIWPGEEGVTRHIAPIEQIYLIEERNKEHTYLVVLLSLKEKQIFIGISIASVSDEVITEIPGDKITESRYFCNQCGDSFITGSLCEICDYDLCDRCSIKYNHIHPMFNFTKYFGIMPYDKDNIKEIYNIAS